MATKSYMVELTEEEALMLVFLGKSSNADSLVSTVVHSVANKIQEAYPRVGFDAKQFALWEACGCPDFDLSAGPKVQP